MGGREKVVFSPLLATFLFLSFQARLYVIDFANPFLLYAHLI
jgi:hypothetical protein